MNSFIQRLYQPLRQGVIDTYNAISSYISSWINPEESVSRIVEEPIRREPIAHSEASFTEERPMIIHNGLRIRKTFFYRFTFTGEWYETGIAFIHAFNMLYERLIRRNNFDDSTLVSIQIRNEYLNSGATSLIGYLPIDIVSGDMILDAMERVIMSQEELRFEDTVFVLVFLERRPDGETLQRNTYLG